jgi:hypothetical protein
MSFRKSSNKHEIWQNFLDENENGLQLSGLPYFIIKTEHDFRDFLTKGVATNPEDNSTYRIENLSSENLDIIWNLINREFQFDMDVIMFDAFNNLWMKKRVSG